MSTRSPAHRARRQPELRQDRPLQPADRRAPEGRQLRRRHGRAQGRQHHAEERPHGLGDRPARRLQPHAVARPTKRVTRDVVLGQRADEAAPDAIVAVVDATNLPMNLRLVLELKRLGRPMVLVAQHGRRGPRARPADRRGPAAAPSWACRWWRPWPCKARATPPCWRSWSSRPAGRRRPPPPTPTPARPSCSARCAASWRWPRRGRCSSSASTTGSTPS